MQRAEIVTQFDISAESAEKKIIFLCCCYFYAFVYFVCSVCALCVFNVGYIHFHVKRINVLSSCSSLSLAVRSYWLENDLSLLKVTQSSIKKTR